MAELIYIYIYRHLHANCYIFEDNLTKFLYIASILSSLNKFVNKKSRCLEVVCGEEGI